MNIFQISLGNYAPPPSIWTSVVPSLVVALVGGVVLWGLNWFREWLTAKWNRHSEAEVLAFSLASELDRLISECSDVVNDPRFEDPNTGEMESTVGTPIVSWGEHLKWSAFPKSLHYRIRALPNKIDIAKKSCAAEAEWGDGPPDYNDYFRERELRFSWIGLEATALRFELSKTYGVEYLDRGAWEPEDDFKAKISQIEKSKAELKKKRLTAIPIRRVSIEELDKRRADLGAALDVMLYKRGLKEEQSGA